MKKAFEAGLQVGIGLVCAALAVAYLFERNWPRPTKKKPEGKDDAKKRQGPPRSIFGQFIERWWQ